LSPGPEDDYDTESWYAVYSGNTDFKAYGYEADFGSAFCCEFTVVDGCGPNASLTLTVNGSGRQDVIHLVDTINGEAMDCSSSYVYAGDESDTINGSNLTSNSDYLYGQSNDDIIHGREGEDYIEGGLGADQLYGESGADDIYGDSPSLSGGGADKIKGGNGDDFVDAGPSDDMVCGGADVDELYGGSGDDKVTGETGVDALNQGDAHVTGDECENQAPNFCETLTSNMTCPW
jgi:Ca2+-binding RTX toxin-like protein